MEIGGGCPISLRWKDQDIEKLKRGGCYEREKQRGKGKQEGAAEKPQREEKDEEGEEKQVGWRVSMIREGAWDRIFILLQQNKDATHFCIGLAPSDWPSMGAAGRAV